MICPTCGRDYIVDSCPCTRGAKVTICRFRGMAAGTTSCGCGSVYRCNLLGKYCADGPLAFPLYEINVVNEDGSTGQMLSKEYQSDSRSVSDSFQACSECGDNSTKPQPP